MEALNPDGTISNIKLDRAELLKRMDRHLTSERVNEIGIKKDVLMNKTLDLVNNNRAILVEGDNTILFKVNKIDITMRVHLSGEQVKNINLFTGSSNRVLGPVHDITPNYPLSW